MATISIILILLIVLYNNLAIESYKKCDTYKCDPSISGPIGNYCYYSKYDNVNQTSDISVYSCSKANTKCEYTKRALGNINDISYKCAEKKISAVTNNLILSSNSLADYENCVTDSDCYVGLTCATINSVKLCTSSKNVGDPCNSNNDCKRLQYCSTVSKTCQLQKIVYQTCLNNDECKNYLGCLNGVCEHLFSKVPGTPMDVANANLCISGFVYDNMCQDIVLVNEFSMASFNVNCTTTEKCNYFLPYKNDYITLNSTQGYCNCGYNPDGNAYCKHGSNSISHNESNELEKKILQRECHISKKFTCDQVTNNDLLNREFLLNSKHGKLQLVKNCVSFFMSKATYLQMFLLEIMLLLIFIG